MSSGAGIAGFIYFHEQIPERFHRSIAKLRSKRVRPSVRPPHGHPFAFRDSCHTARGHEESPCFIAMLEARGERGRSKEKDFTRGSWVLSAVGARKSIRKVVLSGRGVQKSMRKVGIECGWNAEERESIEDQQTERRKEFLQ